MNSGFRSKWWRESKLDADADANALSRAIELPVNARTPDYVVMPTSISARIQGKKFIAAGIV